MLSLCWLSVLLFPLDLKSVCLPYPDGHLATWCFTEHRINSNRWRRLRRFPRDELQHLVQEYIMELKHKARTDGVWSRKGLVQQALTTCLRCPAHIACPSFPSSTRRANGWKTDFSVPPLDIANTMGNWESKPLLTLKYSESMETFSSDTFRGQS